MNINRKQLIIEAATKSFSLFGYKATTMDQVARIANVGKGTIYTFYENKETLFKDIVNRMIDEMIRNASNVTSPDKGVTENLQLVLYQFLKYRKEHQLMVKLFQEKSEMRTPTVLEMVEEVENAMIAFISEKLQLAMEKNLIKECDPELTAFIMLKTYLHLIVDWEEKRKPLTKEEITELFNLYFFQGLSLTER